MNKIIIIIFCALSLSSNGNDPLMTLKPVADYRSFHSSAFEIRDSLSEISPVSNHYKAIGVKPWIAPVALIATGTSMHFMTGFKQNVREYFQEHLRYRGSFEDYSQYAPFVVVYGLNACGVKGKNDFLNRSAILVKSVLLNRLITSTTKSLTAVKRPSGDNRSFPSGHTSMAFTLAHFMHREYGEKSIWFSIGAYSCAATVGILRISKDAHWISDVFAGAGVGILSTEAAYATHRYLFDKYKKNKLTMYPFRENEQNGLTLVYTF